MRYCASHNTCYALLGDAALKGGIMLDSPFSPLAALITRPPNTSECVFAAASAADLSDRGTQRLFLHDVPLPQGARAFTDYLTQRGMRCVNAGFPDALTRAKPFEPGRTGLTLSVVGLGDVGTVLLSGLMLIGTMFDRIQLYDPDAARCARCEMELSQILPVGGHRPRVRVIAPEELFDCDVFAFTASAGVPPIGSTADVRMVQFEKNRNILSVYAKQAREAHFSGLFFQISDPVDLLAREAYLISNTASDGKLDYQGMLPEQIRGLGLGVMLARAGYAALLREPDVSDAALLSMRAYGPHGDGLVVANAQGALYDDTLSAALATEAVGANLRVRETGYKPYIAPALSSACIQIVRALSGEWYDSAVPLDGVYFGCRSRLTPQGMQLERTDMPETLKARVAAAYNALKEAGR